MAGFYRISQCLCCFYCRENWPSIKCSSFCSMVLELAQWFSQTPNEKNSTVWSALGARVSPFIMKPLNNAEQVSKLRVFWKPRNRSITLIQNGVYGNALTDQAEARGFCPPQSLLGWSYWCLLAHSSLRSGHCNPQGQDGPPEVAHPAHHRLCSTRRNRLPPPHCGQCCGWQAACRWCFGSVRREPGLSLRLQLKAPWEGCWAGWLLLRARPPRPPWFHPAKAGCWETEQGWWPQPGGRMVGPCGGGGWSERQTRTSPGASLPSQL